MFFNQDVLFKNGPLAIIWMAGNDDFLRSKEGRNRRSKQYQLMLDSNISNLCDLVRKHFPEMGTENGLSLKKMATLIKGLGFIYLSKIDNLARNINEMNLRLQYSMLTKRKTAIDLPSVSKVATIINDEEMVPFFGFGDLQEMEDMDMGIVRFVPGGTLSPRAHPTLREYAPTPLRGMQQDDESVCLPDGRKEKGVKRKRSPKKNQGDFDETAVLQMLQDKLAANPRANCLLDEDVRMGNGNDFQNMRFGDEMAFDDQPFLPDINQPHDAYATEFDQMNIEMIPVDERLHSPVARLSTTRPETERDLYIPDEVPQAQQTGSPSPSEFKLDSLTPNRLPNRRRRLNKYGKLKIDEEINVPLNVMREQMRLNGGPLDYDELHVILAQKQAPTKKEALRMDKGIQLIEKSGRRIPGKQLSEFLNAKKSLLQNESRERQRLVDSTSAAKDVSNNIIPVAEESANDQADECLERNPNEISDQLPTGLVTGPEISDFGPPTDGLFSEIEGYNMEFVQPDAQEPVLDFMHDVNVDQDQTTFKVMFNPATTSKKHAAKAFFSLLRLQSLRKVELSQDSFYGEITVTKKLG